MQQIKQDQQSHATKIEFILGSTSQANSSTESHSESNSSLNFEDLKQKPKKANPGYGIRKTNFPQEQEEVQILNILPLKETQEKEKQILLQTQIFMRKFAPVIKKNLLLASLNHKLTKEGQQIQLQSQAQTQGDVQYVRDLQSLLELAAQENTRYFKGDLFAQFPELPLLQLASHPLIIEYFADNIQLLYWIDRIRPIIQKEWQEFEYVDPCYLKQDSKNESFNNIRFPHFCWHKAKRMLPMRIIEDQLDNLQTVSSSSMSLNYQDRSYLSEAIENIKEVKGVAKAKYVKAKGTSQGKTKKKKDSAHDVVHKHTQKLFSESCIYNNVELESVVEQKQKEENSSQSSLKPGVKKREEKKITTLVCGYCSRAYHLQCIIQDPKWNKQLEFKNQSKDIIEENKSQGKNPKKSGLNKNKKSKPKQEVQDLYESMIMKSPKDANLKPQEQQAKKKGFLEPIQRQPTEISKEASQAFLQKIGYRDKTQKWACKNCIFGFVIDHLGSQGDFKFQQEVEQAQFTVDGNIEQ